MSELALIPRPAPAPLTIWERVASIFLPQMRMPHHFSAFEGDPEQTRRERPLQAHTQTRWYQGDVESAIQMADQGDLSKAARLARSLRRDGVLGGVLSTRTGGLTRLPKQFRGTDRVAEMMADDSGCRLFNRIFSPKELALLAGDGILLGVGVGELIPLPDRPEPVFVRLDPEFLRYRWSEDPWFYQSIAGELPITPGDGRWILHMPGGYQQPWSNGLWASLARSFVSKDHAFQYRENYSGKLANPARVAVSPSGATDAEQRGLFQKVMAWGVNTVFGLPPGWDVKLLESNGTGFQVFQETIDSADKEFMVALAGQIVTITGGAGFANADIHASIRSDLIQDDGDGLAATINNQALPFIVNQLFGGDAFVALSWDTKPPADLNAEATAISAAARAIGDANTALAPYGMRIDAKEIATAVQDARGAMLPPPRWALGTSLLPGLLRRHRGTAHRRGGSGARGEDDGARRGGCEHGSPQPVPALRDRARAGLPAGRQRRRPLVERGLAADSEADPFAREGRRMMPIAEGRTREDPAAGGCGRTPSSERVPPAEIQLWNVGENRTDYGTHVWSDRSVAEISARYAERGNPLLIDVEHNGANVDGEPALTGGYARLEIRDGAPWLSFDWSAYGAEQIATGQRRFLSPEYDVDADTNEIIRLYRVSLVADPGTHRARVLASAALNATQGSPIMDPTLAAIMSLLDSVSDPAAADRRGPRLRCQPPRRCRR